MGFNRKYRRANNVKGMAIKQETVNEITGIIADQMVGDALLVIVEILDKHWKEITPKGTRMQAFGKLFKEMYQEQSITHSLKNLELLNKANLRRISYGE